MAVVAGEGTVLAVGLDATTSAVIQVDSITCPTIEQAGVDTYHLGSTSKTQRASLVPDLGSLAVSMKFDPANAVHTLVRDASFSGADVYFSVTFSDTAKVTGNGFITSFDLTGMEVDDNLTSDWELKVNALTFVAAV